VAVPQSTSMDLDRIEPHQQRATDCNRDRNGVFRPTNTDGAGADHFLGAHDTQPSLGPTKPSSLQCTQDGTGATKLAAYFASYHADEECSQTKALESQKCRG